MLQSRYRKHQMFQHIKHCDDIEAVGRNIVVLDGAAEYIYAECRPGSLTSLRAQIQPAGFEASMGSQCDKSAVEAPEL